MDIGTQTLENDHVTQSHPYSRDRGYDYRCRPCLQHGRRQGFRRRGGAATSAEATSLGAAGSPTLNPGRGGHPGHPGHPGHWAGHHHGHWVFRNGIWIDIDGVDDVVVTPAVAPAPGPCTCLTKNYTPDGLVVFADICTKELASAPVDGRAADATQVPRIVRLTTPASPIATISRAGPQAPQKN